MRILLVDDTRFARTVERNQLIKLGHDIVGEASDGIEAIEQYKANKPDLVLMDINMPKMDGIEAIEKIVEIDPCAKIIVSSIMGQPSYIKRAIMAGAIDFMIKPFEEEKFQEIIDKIIQVSS